MKATIVFEKNWESLLDLNVRYLLNEGSSRSSKTHSIIQCFYLYALNNPNKRLSVWRDTKKECKETVLNDMLKAYRDMPYFNTITFNKTDSVFIFTNGSRIEIQGTDDANKVHGYQGDIIWLNEPYSISEEVFNQLDMRNSDTVIIDWNPKEDHWIDKLKNDNRTRLIHSTFKDNPFCPENQKIKILSYQPISLCEAVERELLTEGEAKEYNIIENQLNLSEKLLKELSRCKENERKESADTYNWQVYGLGLKSEKPNRIFRWEEITDDKYNEITANVYYGVDWGAVDPWGILEAKYYDGGLYLKELNYKSENKIRETLTPTELQQISNNDEGLVQWYFNKLGIDKRKTIVCDNNRPLKIKALRQIGYDYAVSAVKGAGSIVDGIDLLKSLKVYYTASSKNLKYEQENYSRKVDRYGIVLEEPEDKDNHLCDPARYVVEFLRKEGVIRKV